MKNLTLTNATNTVIMKVPTNKISVITPAKREILWGLGFCCLVKCYGIIITAILSVVNILTVIFAVIFLGDADMKQLSSVGLFFLFFIVLVLIGSNIFPIDEETNTLLAPDWYIIGGIIVDVLFVILFWKIIAIIKKRKVRKEANFDSAVKVILETQQPSASMLQRKLGIDFNKASQLMDELEKAKIVSAFDGSTPRRILIPIQDFQTNVPKNFQDTYSQPVSVVDGMDGHKFEYWCANLLRENGFINVEVTRGSGDQGVDILAEKDGIKYAIQCKCYSSDLGNKPVQEVNTGKEIYHCHIGAVMTNRFFTPGAKQAAEATGILLWDRNKLKEFIENAHRG